MFTSCRVAAIALTAFLCVGFTPNREQTERFLGILAGGGYTIEDISTALDAEPTCRDRSSPNCVISLLNPSKRECSWSQRRCKVRSWDRDRWNDHVSPYPCSLSCTYRYKAGIPATPYEGADCFFQTTDPLPDMLVPDLSFLHDECAMREETKAKATGLPDRGMVFFLGTGGCVTAKKGPDGEWVRSECKIPSPTEAQLRFQGQRNDQFTAAESEVVRPGHPMNPQFLECAKNLRQHVSNEALKLCSEASPPTSGSFETRLHEKVGDLYEECWWPPPRTAR